MALLGAPSSPSVVGMLVSTARQYGKIVHYEAATERVIECDDAGSLVRGNEQRSHKIAAKLYREGISRALEAGVDSLGFTNLCEPRMVTALMPRGKLNERSTRAPPSAVLYVPYRALYAFSFVVSGATCHVPPLPCWGAGFSELPRFSFGLDDAERGGCAQDALQHAVLEIWDDLRQRHAAVAVVGRAARLTPDLLRASSERVLLSFDGVMDDDAWHFGGGGNERRQVRLAAAAWPFDEVRIPAARDYHPQTEFCRTGQPCGTGEDAHRPRRRSTIGSRF